MSKKRSFATDIAKYFFIFIISSCQDYQLLTVNSLFPSLSNFIQDTDNLLCFVFKPALKFTGTASLSTNSEEEYVHKAEATGLKANN